MTDIEKQELWVKLQNELAVAHEERASALMVADKDRNLKALCRICDATDALRALQEASSIRTMLAKIEAIGEKP